MNLGNKFNFDNLYSCEFRPAKVENKNEDDGADLND